AHRDAANAGVNERSDPRVREPRTVGADHHGGTPVGSVGGDLFEVFAQEWLTPGEDEHRGRIRGGDLFDDPVAVGRLELAGRGVPGSSGDVAVRAGQIAALRQIPGDDVRNVRPGARRVRAL